MFQIVLRRLVMSVPLVFVVTFLTFLLNSLAPGDLAQTILGADGTREQYEALRVEMGLDRPLVMQYIGWLGHGNVGDEPAVNLSVLDLPLGDPSAIAPHAVMVNVLGGDKDGLYREVLRLPVAELEQQLECSTLAILTGGELP